MSDTQIFFSSIYDICRTVSKEEFNPNLDENIVFSRLEEPQFPTVSRLITDEHDEFIGCRSIFNTGTDTGPILIRHADRGASFLAHLKSATLAHDVMCVIASDNRIVFPNSFNEFSVYGAIDHYTTRSHMISRSLRPERGGKGSGTTTFESYPRWGGNSSSPDPIS